GSEQDLCGKPLDGRLRRELLAGPVGPALELDFAFREPLRADEDLPGNPDQVGGGEFRARPLVEIVVEHVDPPPGERAIQTLRGRVGRSIPLLEVEHDGPEWRDRLRPLDAGVVMTGLDDGGNETAR